MHRSVIYFIPLSLVFLSIVGCVKQVTRERWVREPYTVTDTVEYTVNRRVPYQATKTVPNYVTIPPVFPSTHDGPLLLAVLPFTSSTGNEYDGIEIAEEIEYELQKHRRAHETYKLLNRTQLGAIFTERQLSRGLNSPSSEKVFESKRILGVEGLITGHVRAKSRDTLHFILKAINTTDATTSFTQRFRGSYNDVIARVVDVFYESRIRQGTKEVPVTRYRTEDSTAYRVEEMTKYKRKKETYTVEEINQDVITLSVVGGLALILWITLFSSGE